MEPLMHDSGERASPVPHTPTTISHDIRRQARLVQVIVAGDVTIASLHAARDAILADPDYQPGMHFLIECRVITSIPTADEIREIALSALLNHADAKVGRVAIVATTARGYEAVSLFELFIDAPQRLALFTDASQARAWLAVSEADDLIS
jgi:hypothetical protein